MADNGTPLAALKAYVAAVNRRLSRPEHSSRLLHDPIGASTRCGVWRASGGKRARALLRAHLGSCMQGTELLAAARFRSDRGSRAYRQSAAFGREDFERYPRTPGDDQRLLAEAGCDLLFLPSVAGMYPDGGQSATKVSVPSLSGILCGAHRPGHFDGVATVVAKLFGIVQPDVAVFGEKDYQQLAIIRRMVQDLALPVEVVGAPTVRSPDGLAMSSRNRYLSPQERDIAPRLYASLRAVAARVDAGEHDFGQLENGAACRCVRPPDADYVSVRDADTLLP